MKRWDTSASISCSAFSKSSVSLVTRKNTSLPLSPVVSLSVQNGAMTTLSTASKEGKVPGMVFNRCPSEMTPLAYTCGCEGVGETNKQKLCTCYGSDFKDSKCLPWLNPHTTMSIYKAFTHPYTTLYSTISCSSADLNNLAHCLPQQTLQQQSAHSDCYTMGEGQLVSVNAL